MCQGIAPVFNFILLFHVFGVLRSVPQTATLLVATMVLSFTVEGVARGGGASYSIPMFIPAGIPVEGVVLLKAVRSIPDLFTTVLNVTADMSAATILSRGARAREPAVPPALVPMWS